jgi:hypothetical protein
MQPCRAGEVEERFVDRERLDQRCQRQHHLPDLASDFDVFFHVRPNDFGMRTPSQCLEHRHGRSNTVGAGDVAGGCDDAPPAAADNHRFCREAGIVSFLHGGVERIAIDMRNRERLELRMASQTRRAASGAAPVIGRGIGETVAAKRCAHGDISL